MEQTYKTDGKSTTQRNGLLIGALVGFVILAVIVAALTYSGVSNFIASWNLTDLPGMVVSDGPTPTPGPEDDPVSGATVSNPPVPAGDLELPPWDGASRVNILVMGLDYRDWVAGEGAPRTDPMMLASVDPISKTAGLLSIPRDLWVNLPGFGIGRINTAYRFGETYELPGGGRVAMKTVEGLLGLPIDYYALIDFSAFERGSTNCTVSKSRFPPRSKSIRSLGTRWY
jgi:hypothetical protein